MDNLSEHNFDDLFREGSEKVEFEYREDAWAALDERLEAKERKRRWLWVLLGLTLSAFIFGTAFYYWNAIQNGPSDVNLIEENVAITEQQIEISETTNVTETLPSASEENINTAKETTSSRLTIQPTTNTDFVQNSAPIAGQILEQKNNNFLSQIETQKGVNLPQEKKKQEKQSLYTAEDSSDNLELNIEIAPITPLSLQEVTYSAIKDVEEFATKTVLLEGSKNQFSFSAFGSLDYNSLSLRSDEVEQGYRIGLRTDYNFARRFSIGIGAAFSRKTYSAQGFRYNAKPGFWTDGIAPVEMDATSNVIEIPLELRFYARGHNKDGFFVGTGINSYHMALEQYNFHYEDVCPDSIDDWEERGTNTNLFSVAAFTIGYQKTISKNLAFQIAPYINLPLTGIGQGDVSLQSTGLNIAVNWRK